MKNLKRLGLSFTLIAVLSTAVYAGDTNSPPCVPGEILTPPCAGQSATAPGEIPAIPGQTEGPPASDDLVDLVEAALWSLSLF